MANRQKAMTKKFRDFWISLTPETRAVELDRFLNYAGKTVAIRGDRDQQKVVYTIRNRFKNSRYKRLAKKDAWRVWSIVYKQQQNFRIEKARINQLLNYLEEQAKPKPSVVIKRTRHRKLVSNG